MHDNDVQMSRVYSREVGGTILDQTFPAGDDVEVVVEAEAGSTIFGLNPPFSLDIVVTNQSTSTVVHTDNISGTLNSAADWPALAQAFEFTVPNAALTQDEVHNVLACLKVGGVNPNVSFAESPMFIITAP